MDSRNIERGYYLLEMDLIDLWRRINELQHHLVETLSID
jgi:hypothetical protein